MCVCVCEVSCQQGRAGERIYSNKNIQMPLGLRTNRNSSTQARTRSSPRKHAIAINIKF